MSLESAKELLAGLQIPKDGRILFEDYLQDAWKLFQFPGLPSLPEFEAFLINAIFNKFAKAEYNRNEAISRDACLVGLGLLKGCYHTETKGGVPTHCALKDRCISYLSGDYVKLQYPYPQENDNLDFTDSDSLPQDAFGQSMRRGLGKLAGTLEIMIKNNRLCQECLRAGIKEHTELVIVSDGDKEQRVRRAILPQPCYTLENFEPKGKKKSTKSTQATVTEPIESAEPMLVSFIKPTQKPASELPSNSTPDLPLDTITESGLKSVAEPTGNSDTTGDEASHPPKADAETPNPTNDKEGKPNRFFNLNKWAVIGAVLVMAIILFVVLLFAMDARNKDRSVDINRVDAPEGDGIINPNEASVETNTSMTIYSSSGATINITGIDNIASVSVITTDGDGKLEQIIVKLDEIYDETVTEQQDATKDFSGGVDAYEGGN